MKILYHWLHFHDLPPQCENQALLLSGKIFSILRSSYFINCQGMQIIFPHFNCKNSFKNMGDRSVVISAIHGLPIMKQMWCSLVAFHLFVLEMPIMWVDCCVILSQMSRLSCDAMFSALHSREANSNPRSHRFQNENFIPTKMLCLSLTA